MSSKWKHFVNRNVCDTFSFLQVFQVCLWTVFLVHRTEKYRSETYYGVVILNCKQQGKYIAVLGQYFCELFKPSDCYASNASKSLNELGATVILSFKKYSLRQAFLFFLRCRHVDFLTSSCSFQAQQILCWDSLLVPDFYHLYFSFPTDRPNIRKRIWQ